MNRDKQIEEMAKLLEKDCGRCYDCDALSKTSVEIACTDYYHANQLYNAGYRKASEVAREIANMLREDLRGFVDGDYLERLLTIYEKKYTEEGK